MNCRKVSNHIINELKKYAKENKINGFVVGVSGGVDSAVVSTLCAQTELPTILISINFDHIPRNSSFNALMHMNELNEYYQTVHVLESNLTNTIKNLKVELPPINIDLNEKCDLVYANTLSRLRMLTLYAYAGLHNMIVVGTGNKVEDFGIGFFTKYGDGGVDISPIGDLMKSEVYELAKYLLVSDEIIYSAPTDGLWEDGRTDEDQIGASYDELEWAMRYESKENDILTERQIEVLYIYAKRNCKNAHKMMPIPVIEISDELKG